jgi:membrane-associated phospholipid phosphatase
MPSDRKYSANTLLLAGGFLLGLMFCALNDRIFLWINSFSSPVLDWFMLSVTHLGNGMVAAMLVLLISPFRRQLTIRAALAMILAGTLTSLVKETVPLPRPPVALGEAVRVLGPKLKYNSFPSGHTSTVFALACSMRSFVKPRVYGAALAVAVLTGVSRVYIGVHFPLDVVIGAMLGWISAWIVERYAGRWADRMVGPRPLFDGIVLVLAALCGIYLAFFERMTVYNPWFLRPLGIAGIAASIAIFARLHSRGDPGP